MSETSAALIEQVIAEMKKVRDEMWLEGVNGWPNSLSDWIAHLEYLSSVPAPEANTNKAGCAP